MESLNLRAIPALRERFGLPVGLSDHSRHPSTAPVAAVALGAAFIEKHYTLSNKLKGPDHSFAVEPRELKELVAQVRACEAALGDGRKHPHPEEAELRDYRRGVFTLSEVPAGATLTTANTAVLRRAGLPPTDLTPKDYPRVLGRKARKALPAYSQLRRKDVA
jgi:sialic acid synthase SpsE